MSHSQVSPSLAQFLIFPAAASAQARNNNNGSSSREIRQALASTVHPPSGYYNSFHSRAEPILEPPPSYAKSNPSKKKPSPDLPQSEPLPSYTPSVDLEAVLGLKHELCSPFARAKNRSWSDVYAILSGTSLSLHKVQKPSFFSKDPTFKPGKLIRQYTLQHAEVGVAMDYQKELPLPKHHLGHFIPLTARSRVYRSDPNLFEPVREHVLRIRPEGDQILLCAPTESELYDWVETISAALDIAPPLEDRTDPRYRSLPRRSRRQRELEASILNTLENDGADGIRERRLIAQQERILRSFQPPPGQAGPSTAPAPAPVPVPAPAPAAQTNDPDMEDLDPADVQEPEVTRPRARTHTETPASHRFSMPVFNTQRPVPLIRSPSMNNVVEEPRQSHNEEEELSELRESQSQLEEEEFSEPRRSQTEDDLSDQPRSKPAQRCIISSETRRLRFRRRCAPILLFKSPRNSDVIIQDGARMRIDPKLGKLIPYEQLPPRYESHHFPLAAKVIPSPPDSISEEPEPESDSVSSNAATGGVDSEEPSSSEPGSDISPFSSPRPKPNRNISAYSLGAQSTSSISNHSSSSSSPGTPTSERDVELGTSSPLEQSSTRDTVKSNKSIGKHSIKESRVNRLRLMGTIKLRDRMRERAERQRRGDVYDQSESYTGWAQYGWGG